MLRNCIFSTLAIVIIAGCLDSVAARAQAADADGPPEGLKLTLVFAKRQYRVGERIRMTLRYTYKGALKLSAVSMDGDHPGRPTAVSFTAAGENGAKCFDPSRYSDSAFCGGYPYKNFGADGVCEDKADLNEWVVFETPGVFQVTGWSRAVGDLQNTSGNRNERCQVLAEPAALEILPADRAVQFEEIKAAEIGLKSNHPEVRSFSARTLWFMRDERAIPLLIHCLGDTQPTSNLHRSGYVGLLLFDNMEPIKNAVLKRMADDPDFPHPYIANDIAMLLAKCETEKESSNSPHWERWAAKLKKRYIDRLKQRDPEQAVNEMVQMMGGGQADRQDKELWESIFKNFELLNENNRHTVGAVLLPELHSKEYSPQLKHLAEDEAAGPEIRSGAIVAMFKFGDTSARELVYEDLIKPETKFSNAAHETLGTYKEKERGAALLKLADADAPANLGQRIRNFATAASGAELAAAYERLALGSKQHGGAPIKGLLTAVAIAEPQAAFKIISEKLNNSAAAWHVDSEIFQVLVRLKLPEAKRLTGELIWRLDGNMLRALIIAIGDAAHENSKYERRIGDDRVMPFSDETAKAVFGDLLDWLLVNPEGQQRDYARRTLHYISGIPQSEQHISDAESEALAALWAVWRDAQKPSTK